MMKGPNGWRHIDDERVFEVVNDAGMMATMSGGKTFTGYGMLYKVI